MSTPGEVISEFTTGSASETEELAAPTFAATVLTGREISSEGGGSCGAYTLCHYNVEVPTLDRAHSLRVMRGGSLVGYFGSPLQFGVLLSGISYDRSTPIFQSGEQLYQVSVVDQTGNESPATTLAIPACTAAPDAGVSTSDAGASAADGSVPTPDGGAAIVDGRAPAASERDGQVAVEPDSGIAPRDQDGCALARTHASWTTAIWIALAILVTRRRHRGAT